MDVTHVVLTVAQLATLGTMLVGLVMKRQRTARPDVVVEPVRVGTR